MKKSNFNNSNYKKISSNSPYSYTNRNHKFNNFNHRENNKNIKKLSRPNINDNIKNNNKNAQKKKLIIHQNDTNTPGKKIKTLLKEKEKEKNIIKIPEKEEKKNIEEEKNNNSNKKLQNNLILTKEEINKIINDTNIFPKSKTVKKELNKDLDNIKIEKNVALIILKEKQKCLNDIINKIKTQKNYLKESSLNNLPDKNIIYKNIHEEKIKDLNNDQLKLIDKIDLVQDQINSNNKIVLAKVKNKEEVAKQIDKNKADKKYNLKFKKMKVENQKICEKFKNLEMNLEQKLKDIALLEKAENEKLSLELKEKIEKNKTLEKRQSDEVNSEVLKNKRYINSYNERENKDYLYYKLEKTFEEREKKYINNSKKNKKLILKNILRQKDKKEYTKKKKVEMTENINKLHKIWKERNSLLPKYRSPLLQKALISDENMKKIENDKIEKQKLLYLNKENYAKKLIQLPPINKLLKRGNSLKIELIHLNKLNNNTRTNRITEKFNKIKLKEQHFVKSNSVTSLRNNNENQTTNENLINISLKKRSKINLRSPNDFNYLEDIKRGKLLNSNSENNLLKNNNNINNQDINYEKEMGEIELLEDKYKMNKKLLKIKGGYLNDLELGDKMNEILIKGIENKLDICENMNK
jgi:hypothetical protein